MILASSAAQQASGTITFSTGSGSAVTSVDRSTKFDTVVDGVDLSNFTEDQLSITTPGTAQLDAFGPFPAPGDANYFCAGNNKSWVTIKAMDGRTMVGVEFLYANVFSVNSFVASIGHPNALVEWQAYLGATLVSSNSSSTAPLLGSVIGFHDLTGFDTLLVRAILEGDEINQAIALDNLKVQLVPIPEPSTWAAGAVLVLGFGVQGVREFRNRKQGS